MTGAALVLVVAASVAAVVASGSSGAASRRYTIAYVIDGYPLNDPREHAVVRGGRAAAKALGVQFIAAASGDPRSDVMSMIARHVDAIATEAYDRR